MWLIIGVSGATCSGKSSLARTLHETLPGSLLLCQDDFFLPVDSEHHTWISALNHINWEIMTSLDMNKMHAAVENILSSKNKNVLFLKTLVDIVSKMNNSCVADNKVGTVVSSKEKNIGDTSKDIKNSKSNESLLTVSNTDTLTKTNTDGNATSVMTCNDEVKIPEDIEQCTLGVSVLIIEGFLVLNDEKLAELCQLKYFMTLTKEQCWARRHIRTYNPPDVPGYFDQCVWPEYEKHRNQVFKKIPDVILLDGIVDTNIILNQVLLDVVKAIRKLLST